LIFFDCSESILVGWVLILDLWNNN